SIITEVAFQYGVMERASSSLLARNVQNLHPGTEALTTAPSFSSVNREFQVRFTAALLILVTAAAGVLGWINFQKEQEFQIPYDGVWWTEHGSNLVADRVEANGPGEKAGIRRGDLLAAINQHVVKDASGFERQLYGVGAWSKA